MLVTRGPRTFGDVSPACGRRNLFDIRTRRQERCAQDGDRPQDQCQQSAHDVNSSSVSRGHFREGEALAEPWIVRFLAKRLSRSFALPIAQKTCALEAKSRFILPVRARLRCRAASAKRGFQRLSPLDPVATIQPRRFAYPIRPLLALAPASDSRPSAPAPMNGCPNLGPALPVRPSGRRPLTPVRSAFQWTGSADGQRLLNRYNSGTFESSPRSDSRRNRAAADNPAPV